MKTNTICWLPESFYRNEEYKQLLIENNIVPLLDSSYSKAIWEAEGRPETMRYLTYGYEIKLPDYSDEPISTGAWDMDKLSTLSIAESMWLGEMEHTTIGETSTETISQLVDAGCKSITFTCYGWHLFRIFGINIRMPFTTQLNTWKKLEKLYGVQFNLETFKKTRESKFDFIWIMIDQIRHFEKLINWALSHNKTIGLVAPDRYKDNPEWVKEHLAEFIKQYKEVVK